MPEFCHSPSLLTRDFEDDVVYFYQVGGVNTLRSISPLCTKLEIWLRMTKIPHKVINLHPLHSKTTLPCIELNRVLYEDSSNVIQHLRKYFNCDIDANLSSEERAIALAFERLIEEHLRFHVAASTYTDDEGYKDIQPIFKTFLPPVLRNVVPYFLLRRRMQKTITLQGIGSMILPLRIQRFQEDLQALAEFLADKPYFFGNKPTSIDACVFGVLHRIAQGQANTLLKKALTRHINLIAYTQRLTTKYLSRDMKGLTK